MLRMSGAGECTDRAMRDMRDMRDMQEHGVLATDGSNDLSLFWRLNEVLGGVRFVEVGSRYMNSVLCVSVACNAAVSINR